jgi:hypothetical protein
VSNEETGLKEGVPNLGSNHEAVLLDAGDSSGFFDGRRGEAFSQ